ncbi:DUF2769 domain-containing protein [Methanolobus bombayensis]|uniref:DUF2769 domain-containing protein n=1 Tax=Methanolobus bombayensis TaxID=38023 RepID=UPI001AE232BF|nr:DUF2769 domain-containing protein [Methanolobus bombayensis]MBP1908091.1 hypothetical protein [Methanolobus bombayensis]
MGNVEKSKDNVRKCICIKCPSYSFACKIKAIPESAVNMLKGDIANAEHMEGLFCAFGKSKCIEEQKGCICPECDVYKENGLNNVYFCL